MLGYLVQADADLETGQTLLGVPLAGFPPPKGGPSR